MQENKKEKTMRDYTKIRAWQFADDLTVAVYGATKAFPKDEIYSLTSQLRRAAYSVPANIVEGSSRSSQKDYLHFLYIARGSLNETRYFLHLSHRLEYLTRDDFQRLSAQANDAISILTGLIKSVEREANPVTKAAAKLTSFITLSLGLAALRLP
jgi:four helix bundle protein